MLGLTTNYRGVKIGDTSGTENWFSGTNASNQFVVRRNGTTDDLTINASGAIAAQSTITAPTFVGTLNGNATTATTASAAPWSGITGKPATIAGITGADSVDANPNARLVSGFYQNSAAATANGWPENGGWWHLLASTHSNVANNYSMQFAADFFSNKLYYRSTN